MERLNLKRAREEPDNMDTLPFDPIQVLDTDLNNLELETGDHSKWVGKFTKIYRRKYEKMRKEELKLEIVEDECAEKVRNDPEEYGIKKGHRLTDALINRTIKRHFSKYRKQHAETYKAKAEEKEWEGYLKAIIAKGADIKVAADLWSMNYFDIVVRERKSRRRED